MTITAETIQRKIEFLSDDIAVLRKKIATNQESLSQKELRIEVFRELLEEDEDGADIAPIDVILANHPPWSNQKPAKAVEALLRQTPGLSATDIIDTLEKQIDSSAKDKRHNIRTTIFNMVRNQKLVKNPDHTYDLAQKNGSHA